MHSEFAVFVDRDGTINVEVDFLSSPGQLRLIPRSAAAIRELNELGIPVIVITNQSGIARGLFSEEDLQSVHAALDRLLESEGASVTDYFYCPHHPSEGIERYVTDCECRKPKPGMLIAAQKRYGFDLRRSFVIGDKCADMKAARSAGSAAVQVATGYGAAEKDLCVADRDFFAADLFEAVQFIKDQLTQRRHP